MQVLLVFLVLLHCPLPGSATEYSTLEFDYSAEVAEVPSRALLTTINVGVPVLRRTLMVDFASDSIELEDCIKKQSYTYDLNDTSDVILFEEEHITDARARASYRFGVREHCEDIGQLGDRYYKNCLSEHCQGIVGLSRRSAFWNIWSSFTLGLDGVKLGSDHPRSIDEGGRGSPAVACLPDTAGVCDFAALLGGADGTVYRVSVHTENSYTYLPTELYERVRETGTLDLLDASDPGHQLLLRLDRSTLVHTPDAWHAHSATSRSASNLFFSQHTRRAETLLAKPWANNTAISIGNAALQRYTLHVNLAANRMTVELRLRREHLSVPSVLVALVMFFSLMRSVCLSTYEMSWLANGLPISCACGEPRNHSKPTDAFFHWLAAVGVLLVSLYAVVDSARFIDEVVDMVFLYGLFSLNWFILGVQLCMPVSWQRHLHRHGHYSPRHFRRVFTFSFPFESLMILSLLFVLATVRQDSLGTLGTFVVALFGVFNAWRYGQYWLVSPQPSAAPIVLLVVNLLVGVPVLAWRVVYDFLLSRALALGLVVIVVMTSSVVVDRHSRARLAYAIVLPAKKLQ